jgi:hypothetical protein
MTHQALESIPSDSVRKTALSDIEQLMTELASQSGDFEDAMQERLEAARFYLLNSMPEEYNLTLDLARQTLPNIQADGIRKHLADFLQGKSGERQDERGR